MTKGKELRDYELNKVASHNRWWMNRASQELRWIRNARIRQEKVKDQIFTFEEILKDLEYLIGPIPNHALCGAVTMAAIKLKIIEATNTLKHTEDLQKHARRAMAYKWVK